MTDPRKPVFDAVRSLARPGLFADPGNILALDNLLDAFDVPRPTGGASTSRRSLRDPVAFFAAVRKITGPLDDVQVSTINSLLTAAAHWPIGWLAYGLATAWHEARLKPIPEYGKGAGKPYGKAGKHGQAQYGRGLVQLTWDANYEWADKALGLGGSLLKNFDRALEPEIATAILVKGMTEGAFTGKSLKDYLPEEIGKYAEFVQARRIINGVDKAPKIADHAIQFQSALVAGGWK